MQKKDALEGKRDNSGNIHMRETPVQTLIRIIRNEVKWKKKKCDDSDDKCMVIIERQK